MASISLNDAHWSTYRVTLGKVNADLFEFPQNGFILNKLGDSLFTHDMTNIVDRTHHRQRNRVINDILNEPTIDF